MSDIPIGQAQDVQVIVADASGDGVYQRPEKIRVVRKGKADDQRDALKRALSDLEIEALEEGVPLYTLAEYAQAMHVAERAWQDGDSETALMSLERAASLAELLGEGTARSKRLHHQIYEEDLEYARSGADYSVESVELAIDQARTAAKKTAIQINEKQLEEIKQEGYQKAYQYAVESVESEPDPELIESRIIDARRAAKRAGIQVDEKRIDQVRQTAYRGAYQAALDHAESGAGGFVANVNLSIQEATELASSAEVEIDETRIEKIRQAGYRSAYQKVLTSAGSGRYASIEDVEEWIGKARAAAKQASIEVDEKRIAAIRKAGYVSVYRNALAAGAAENNSIEDVDSYIRKARRAASKAEIRVDKKQIEETRKTGYRKTYAGALRYLEGDNIFDPAELDRAIEETRAIAKQASIKVDEKRIEAIRKTGYIRVYQRKLEIARTAGSIEDVEELITKARMAAKKAGIQIDEKRVENTREAGLRNVVENALDRIILSAADVEEINDRINQARALAKKVGIEIDEKRIAEIRKFAYREAYERPLERVEWEPGGPLESVEEGIAEARSSAKKAGIKLDERQIKKVRNAGYTNLYRRALENAESGSGALADHVDWSIEQARGAAKKVGIKPDEKRIQEIRNTGYRNAYRRALEYAEPEGKSDMEVVERWIAEARTAAKKAGIEVDEQRIERILAHAREASDTR